VKTPPMFYPQEDGKLVEIPEEHAKVLELYRDRMPLCFEVQETGQPYLYALIDVDEEPCGSPLPSQLETAALRVARALRARRLGDDMVAVDYRDVAQGAIRAHVADMAEFAAACTYDEPMARRERYATQEARRIGRQLTKVVESAVAAVAKDPAKVVLA
jgi:hypothetical protein